MENVSAKGILEWRGRRSVLDIYKHLVQFRASGIRVLKNEIAPSLISMTPTQIPVVPLENRYMSEYEAAKLQNLHDLQSFPKGTTKAFKAFGNAVNAKVVSVISKRIHLILNKI
jgi:DNA (cytosine-5)-methyltransferase 1